MMMSSDIERGNYGAAAAPPRMQPVMVGTRSRASSLIRSRGSSLIIRSHGDSARQRAHDCEADDNMVAIPVVAKCEVEQISGLPVHHHAGHTCHDPAALFMLGEEDGDDTTINSRRKIGTYILEFGIATHSILIGLALGVTPAPEFIPLLFALIFHQFFEGVALGTRIGELSTMSKQRKKFVKALVMAGVFAVTTPIGIIVGILLREVYAGTSTSALVLQGVFDAVSAGILLYVAFVHLLAEEVTNNARFHGQKVWQKVVCFGALWSGAAVMAVIGKWA